MKKLFLLLGFASSDFLHFCKFRAFWPIVIAAFVADKPLTVVVDSCREGQPTPGHLYMGK